MRLLPRKLWSEKGGILIFVDNVPLGFKLSCCGSFVLGFFSFIQIDFAHAAQWFSRKKTYFLRVNFREHETE